INTIGVPVLGTGATFQQLVANLNVVSNVPGVTTGDGQQGNIEFWPTNYEDDNTLPVPGASDLLFDFGDKRTPGNYGSMQIHNTSGAQTVIAFNNWGGAGTGVDIGIGNNPAPINGGIDWTFANNGAGLTVRKLQMLVRTSGDLTPPTLASAAANFGKDRITVVFSEPVRRETLVAGNFSLDNGVTVLGVTIGDDLHEVLLETTTQPAAALTLTVSNVRDTSPNANPITPGSTIAVTPASLPAEVIANIGAAADGYELVYTLDIPNVGNFNAGNPYTVDNSASGSGFSRIAYYLELQSGTNPVQYVWASMDAFTGNKGKIGVPTVASGALFAQKVSNLDVISNKAGVVNGTGLSTGNLEFWPSNYTGNNDAGVPGAAGSFDFGDGGVGHGAGYGSMQIHNYGASQTLFAMNNFGNDGGNLCLGIGNRPTSEPDWTFAENAGSYSRKVMHIMVLPSTPTPVPAEVTAAVNVRAPGEADGYQLIYSLDLPASGNLVGGGNFKDYSFNDSGRTEPFSRVAYYLELQKDTDPGPTFVWVSMDAFSDDRVKIGVPSVASGAFWQRYVTNMNIVSNSSNVTEGTVPEGNLEFWPGSYNGNNWEGINIPGATDSFDFGDGGASNWYGHGSMQVHNYVAGQTLFAINNWGNYAANNNFGVGIGNDPLGGATTDYTFAATAASYNVTRRLHVLVLPGPSPLPVPGLAFTEARGSTTLDRLVVTFDREVADASAAACNFTIDGGVTVTGATLLAGNREIALTTSAQTAGVLYTVSATGVQDRGASGALITPGSTVPFTAYTPPAALANVPDVGYELIYQLAIPAAQPRWNANTIPYSVDEAQYGERLFDRVAYLLELDGNWVYASFDPHTNRIAQIGVPTLGVSSTPFQNYVTNMNVDSNVPGIVTGSGITTGNIEFWGANYEQPNSLGIPNANDGTYDFGDRMTPGEYGSMQVHNHGASQTLFAYNNWALNSGGNSDLGIGNNPGPGDPDWTFSGSAGNYAARNLYVLARPGGVASGPAPEIFTQPCGHEVAGGSDVTFGVDMFGSGPFTYQWRRNGTPIAGATLPWLELSSVSAADVAAYDVVVTGANLVSLTSNAASLTLIGGPPTAIESWRTANGFDPADGSTPGEGDVEDKEADGLVNLLEFGFGTNPNVADNLPLVIDGSRNGTPILDVQTEPGVTYAAVFTRRDDHGQAGSVEYTVQFSRDLETFYDSTDTPVFVTDSTDDPAYEIVKVPYPLVPQARFFRVKVTAVP
ncbi:MAG: hypothetical protein K9N23_14495, partial [Akkermansiaceae bacterium]|nr:hypothetical protein [Akkermansiaceae bacterium]